MTQENEPKGMMGKLRDSPYLRMFLWGIVLVFFAWGLYSLGAYNTCSNGDGTLVGGVIPKACISVRVIEVVQIGDKYYLPGENYTPQFVGALNYSGFDPSANLTE